MACYYYLRLPTGGELRIPASFSNLSLTNSSELRGLIDNYKNNEKDSISDLVSYITNNTPLQSKDFLEILKSVPIDNTKITDEDLVKLIDSVNNTLSKEGDYQGLILMLKNSIFHENEIEFADETGKWSPIKIDKLIKELNKPIYIDYFKDIDADTILGGSSYIQVAEQIKFKRAQIESIGLNSEIYDHFETMMKYAFPRESGVRTTKTFFQTRFKSNSPIGIDDSVVIYDEKANNPIIFYNEASDLSLHFAIFKILGTTLLQEKQPQLSLLITEFNKVAGENVKINPNQTPEEFFHGIIDIEGNRKDPEFYNLLKYKYGEKTLQRLAYLMAEGLPEKEMEKLTKAFVSIVNFMDPVNLSKYNQILEINRTNKGIQNNQILQGENLQIKNIVSLSSRDNRKYHYNIAEQTEVFETANQINNFLNANIRKNLDIIKIEFQDVFKKKSQRYIVPTYWRVLDEGVFIRGWYEDNGTLIKYEGKIPKNKSITYSILNSLTKPTLFTEDSKSGIEKPLIIKIDPKNPLPPSLLLNLIRRGTYIKYFDSKGTERSGNVKNIFPGGLELNLVSSKSGLFNPTPKLVDIIEVHTNASILETVVPPEILTSEEKTQEFLLNRSLEIIKELKKWGRDVPISVNDWISVKTNDKIRYNLVIGTSKDNLFILVQSSKGSRIETIKKSDIINVFKKEQFFDSDLFDKVGAFYSDAISENSIKKYNYSIFTDYERAMRGDLIWSPSKQTLYKITNKENKELVKYFIKGDGTFVEYSNDFPSDGVFITDRNIASNNYGLAIDFNNFKLSTKSIGQGGEDARKYFVPKNTIITPDMLMASGNLTTGYVHFLNEKFDESLFRDATKEVVNLINKSKKGKSTDSELVVTTIKGYNQRYDANLYESKYDKSKNKFLQEYAYVTLKRIVSTKDGEKITQSHKYRIITREGDKLLLEYNTYNRFGEVVTVNKYLDLSTEEDNIFNVYLMFGNRNLNSLKSLDTKNSAIEEKATKVEQISNLIDSFQNLYKIDVVPESNIDSGFKRKKAWIDADSGKNKIIINTNINNSEEELVHEYLHLFLMAAKYNNLGVYESLLVNYLKSKGESTQNINFEEVEENFVNEVNKEMWHNREKLKSIDINSFLILFEQIMKQLKVIEDNDVTFSPKTGSFESVFSVLNYKMSDIFKSTESKKSRTNLLYYDANFKNWLNELINNQGNPNKDNLIINCE